MSLAKRILFGNDPGDDAIRRRISEAAGRRIAAFPFTIPTRRRNRLECGPYWDPWWRSSLAAAAEELGIETIRVNSKCCTRTRQEADVLQSRAEILHDEKVANWKRLLKNARI